MSKYNVEEIIKLWATEQITVDQAIGQILLHLQALTKRVLELEQEGRKPPSQIAKQAQ